MFTRTRRDARSVEIQYITEGFHCPAKKYLLKSCHKYGHFTSLCYQKKQASFKSRKPKACMLQAGAVYACDKSMCGQFVWGIVCHIVGDKDWNLISLYPYIFRVYGSVFRPCCW